MYIWDLLVNPMYVRYWINKIKNNTVVFDRSHHILLLSGAMPDRSDSCGVSVRYSFGVITRRPSKSILPILRLLWSARAYKGTDIRGLMRTARRTTDYRTSILCSRCSRVVPVPGFFYAHRSWKSRSPKPPPICDTLLGCVELIRFSRSMRLCMTALVCLLPDHQYHCFVYFLWTARRITLWISFCIACGSLLHAAHYVN